MMESQKVFTVKSVEQGIRKVLEWPINKVAFLAGRETLYFDTRRFGKNILYIFSIFNIYYSFLQELQIFTSVKNYTLDFQQLHFK